MLSKLGFEACKTAACVFYHPDRKLQIVSHVDDFLCAGDAADLRWLRSQLQESYEVDSDVLGLRDGESTEGKFLGRMLRYTSAGIEWEADPKQVTSLIADVGMEDRSGVDTPGVKSEVEVEGVKMGSADASKFRRGAAKFNYLAQDRVDIAFASKEISKLMACPKMGDEVLIKRVVRYLSKHPRLVVEYRWQDDADEVVVFTDSDWGG